MKLTTRIVNKFGSDRLLHYSVCLNITLAGGYFGDLGLFIGFVVAIILSVLKEYVFDDKEEGNEADWVDCYWGFGGAFTAVILYVISILVK